MQSFFFRETASLLVSTECKFVYIYAQQVSFFVRVLIPLFADVYCCLSVKLF